MTFAYFNVVMGSFLFIVGAITALRDLFAAFPVVPTVDAGLIIASTVAALGLVEMFFGGLLAVFRAATR